MKYNKIGDWETFEIFSYSDSEMLQLYKSENLQNRRDKEIKLINSAKRSGFPVQEITSAVEINNKPGFLFKKIDAEIMAVQIRNDKSKLHKYAELQAMIHLELHSKNLSIKSTNFRDYIIEKISNFRILTQYINDLLILADSIFCENFFCHWDFGPYHILLENYNYYILDWASSGYGDRIASIANSVFWLCSDYVPGIGPYLLNRNEKQNYINNYLGSYNKKIELDRDKLTKWLIIFSAIEYDCEIQDEGPAEDLNLLFKFIEDYFNGLSVSYFDYLIMD